MRMFERLMQKKEARETATDDDIQDKKKQMEMLTETIESKENE